MGRVVQIVRYKAFAKVNYALDVVGTRADGYHEIRTVMQTVSLTDEVEIRRAKKDFELRVEPEEAEVGPHEGNTAYHAWRLVCERAGRELPARIHLHKNVPAGAGLGGGSADAAAVLRGLNDLFGLGLTMGEMREIGSEIGADVPFLVSGGTALAEGVGEILTPAPRPPSHHVLIVKPAAGIDTGKVYRAYDANPIAGRASDGVLAALDAGDLYGLAGSLGNDLAPAAKAMVPKAAALERDLLGAGALGASVTGSGTAVYGLFRDGAAAERARQEIDAPFASVCVPVARGHG